MPDYKPNQFIRVFAVLALAAAIVAVVAVIATSGGGSDDGGGGGKNGSQEKSEVTKRGRQAVERGVWVVHSGDTLGHIALETGIDVETLGQLNPKIDPQVLLEGERIHLR